MDPWLLGMRIYRQTQDRSVRRLVGAREIGPRGVSRFTVAVLIVASLYAAVPAGAQAPARRYTAEEVVSLLRSGVTESRMLALITDGCVIRGGEADVQAALRRGGASARVLRLAGTLVCPDAPPATAPTTAPPRSTGAGSAPAARFGLGDDQFVLVAAGRFGMGSETGDADERPVHQVTISRAFYLQKTEVTQAQWQAVMGTNPSSFTACGPSCPVERVSWDDVQQFIERLNQATGLQYRLPTEAEWEYAARAGTTGDYGGTGVLSQMGWTSENSGNTLHPVGHKQANAWGLHDMHGNVWEWVQDWYDAGYYARSLGSDPPGPPTGQYRVLRGGSWLNDASNARSANRYNFTPDHRNSSSVGFRLARTP